MKIMVKIIKLIGRLSTLYTTIYSILLLFMLILAGTCININILSVILVVVGILRFILCIRLLFILYKPYRYKPYIIGIFIIMLIFIICEALFYEITIEGIDFNNAILPVLIALLANWIDSLYDEKLKN